MNFNSLDTSAFMSPASLKLQLLLFYHPYDINKSFKALGNKIGVSSVAIHKIYKTFLEMNFVIARQGERKGVFKSDKETIKNWINIFNIKMRKKLFIGKYRTFSNTTLNSINPSLENKAWYSGDLGNNQISTPIMPQKTIIYIKPETKIEIMKELCLRPDNNGDVILYKKFWNFNWSDNNYENNIIAPPILIAADLKAEQDPRSVEASNKIIETCHKDIWHE